ncbi:hypothetical protein SEA_OTTAWA_89 [Arthrobacter phage Ottawa]|nr:hypothetical protein SEA_KHARCHO_89 [Arthrobacter phage Kharcho]WIC89321.1 hypothetical protein SEA_OTTAWA_89 [Arthrobacter phage Ottawa]
MKKLTASVLEVITAENLTGTAIEVANAHAAKTVKNVTKVAIDSRLAAIDELVELGLAGVDSEGQLYITTDDSAEETPAADAETAAAIEADATEEEHSEEEAEPKKTPASPETLERKRNRLSSLKARLAAATERRVARQQTEPNATELTLTRKIAGVEAFIATHS